MIVEKLRARGYFWNNAGELTANNIRIKNSRIVDCFAYMLRSTKTLTEPLHFNIFWSAVQKSNIPHSWIANKKLLAKLKKPPIEANVSSEEQSEAEHREERPSSSKTPPRQRSRSVTPRKWLEY